jgi:hypothetical protein
MVHGSPELRADPKEVAEIFEVPLSALSDRRYYGRFPLTENGSRLQHPAILYNGQVIWGLTYDLTIRFLELMPPPP